MNTTSRTILIMAGGTGGHVFGSGRATRLTFATLTLAYAENVATSGQEPCHG